MSPRSTNNFTSGSRACQLPACAGAQRVGIAALNQQLDRQLVQPEGGWRLHARESR
jgi:hypothetical protein